MGKTTTKKYRTWRRYLCEETDAAFLYGILEMGAPVGPEQDLYARLRETENRHAAKWSELLQAAGAPATCHPSVKARLMAMLSRFGRGAWLGEIMLRQEGTEVSAYLSLYRHAGDPATRDAALELARDSAVHAQSLSQLKGRSGEPWHRTDTGGILRSVVYGFNDGLTANFGLIAGVVGARADDHFILLSGAAGLIADALSMGASGFLAAKSEKEVYAHEIAMEAEEIRLMPELETEELAAIYESKGISPELSRQLASQMMRQPAQALEEKTREELGLGSGTIHPAREAWLTGSATAIGALIPLIPFFLWSGTTAAIVAFALAMLMHFGVGASRSLFTGKTLWRSGWEMSVVGMGVAVVGYVLGDAVTHFF